MKLVKALMLVAAISAVNFAYADGNTCQNNTEAPRGDSKQVQTEKRTAEVFVEKSATSKDASASS